MIHGFGAKIIFFGALYQAIPGCNMAISAEASAIRDAEVNSLSKKGAILHLSNSDQYFVIGIFSIPNSSGGFRPITKVKALNNFVLYQHFKMEGVNILKKK